MTIPNHTKTAHVSPWAVLVWLRSGTYSADLCSSYYKNIRLLC